MYMAQYGAALRQDSELDHSINYSCQTNTLVYFTDFYGTVFYSKWVNSAVSQGFIDIISYFHRVLVS